MEMSPLLAAHEAKIDALTARLDSLQKIVIENHERRLGKLDNYEGKPPPHHNIFAPMLKGTDVDHSSPQYQGEIHQ